jgi:hypothetical protein
VEAQGLALNVWPNLCGASNAVLLGKPIKKISSVNTSTLPAFICCSPLDIVGTSNETKL